MNDANDEMSYVERIRHQLRLFFVDGSVNSLLAQNFFLEKLCWIIVAEMTLHY